jgi:phage tail-like protein
MPSATQPASGQATDPFAAYNFKLEMQGVTEGHFTACAGLGVSVQVISYREGGNNQVVHRIPGPVEYADVTLRYGLTRSRELWDWLLTAVQGRVQRRNVSIVVLDTDGATEVVRWNLFNAWVSQWRAAPLDALGRDVAIDSITLVYDTLERA